MQTTRAAWLSFQVVRHISDPFVEPSGTTLSSISQFISFQNDMILSIQQGQLHTKIWIFPRNVKAGNATKGSWYVHFWLRRLHAVCFPPGMFDFFLYRLHVTLHTASNGIFVTRTNWILFIVLVVALMSMTHPTSTSTTSWGIFHSLWWVKSF